MLTMNDFVDKTVIVHFSHSALIEVAGGERSSAVRAIAAKGKIEAFLPNGFIMMTTEVVYVDDEGSNAPGLAAVVHHGKLLHPQKYVASIAAA